MKGEYDSEKSYRGVMGKYDFGLDMYDENTISWIANSVEPDSDVLEFGPANGRLTRYLKEYKNCKVDIVEIDEESGSEAAQYAENALIGVDKGDIEKYYWLETGKKYDFIIFADVLEHLVHADEVLKRCRIAVKETGKVLVSVPNVAHNSVIIELLNDEFHYNPTGILDNTHVRFFTRSSFQRMAGESGWAVVNERAKRIRVGETEIKNTYGDVPKELAKELIHRPLGDVYQYMFVLTPSTEYLYGNQIRTVSLDSTSHYITELVFENNGEYDFRKTCDRYFDPYDGMLDVTFDVITGSNQVQVKPINSNCVLGDLEIQVLSKDNTRTITEFSCNGKTIGSQIFFVNDNPCITVGLQEQDEKIRISTKILKYDFEDELFGELLSVLEYEQGHIQQVCQDYEKEMARRTDEYEKEKNAIISGYEAQIRKMEETNTDFFKHGAKR